MKRFKRLYRPVMALLIRALARLVRVIPRRLALDVGGMLGSVFWRLDARRRRRALENVDAAFGSSSQAGRARTRRPLRQAQGRRPERVEGRRETVRIARECFRTLGRCAVDTVRLPAMTGDEIASLVDADSFAPAERVLARGKGLIVLTAHVGAWEVMGAYFATRFGRPFHAIGKRIYYEPYNELAVRIRRSFGVETVYQEDGARPALEVLRSNRPLAMLADLYARHLEGVYVDFFGRPAHTSTGPVALARASGAGLVPFFITSNGLRYRVHVLPEVDLVRTRDRAADAMENTRRWSRVVEDFIRRYPAHWTWFHPRWRRRAGEA